MTIPQAIGTKLSVIRVDQTAPVAPYSGIQIKLRKILINKPQNVKSK